MASIAYMKASGMPWPDTRIWPDRVRPQLAPARTSFNHARTCQDSPPPWSFSIWSTTVYPSWALTSSSLFTICPSLPKTCDNIVALTTRNGPSRQPANPSCDHLLQVEVKIISTTANLSHHILSPHIYRYSNGMYQADSTQVHLSHHVLSPHIYIHLNGTYQADSTQVHWWSIVFALLPHIYIYSNGLYQADSMQVHLSHCALTSHSHIFVPSR